VEPRHFHGGPVQHEAGHDAAADHDVLDGDAVEDPRSGLERLRADRAGGLDGVGRVVAGRVEFGAHAEEIENLPSLLLDDDLVEHHAAAPHPAADAELSLEDRRLASGLRQKVSSHETGGTAADNRHVEFDAVQKLFQIPFRDGPRDHDFAQFHSLALPFQCAASLSARRTVF